MALKGKLRWVAIVAAISVVPTLLVWAPFFFGFERVWGIPIANGGMSAVIANYDGPLYMVVAKTLYDNELIKTLFSFPLPTEYYAAHFPLYPFLIRLFAPLLGFPYAMMIVTVLSSFLATYFFYKLCLRFVKREQAVFLTLVFSVLPARWLIVRSVGSPEPLFIGAVIASLYYFTQKKYLWAGIWGVVAQLTKSPGILLFIAYVLAILQPSMKRFATKTVVQWLRKIEWKAYPILLIPLSLGLVFVIFQSTFGNFFAYFNSGDNIHLLFPPFQIFNSSASWVGTFWLEEVIFVYLFAILGFVELWRLKDKTFAIFVGVFFFSIIFVSHRDIMRYSLPIVPFLLIGFKDLILRKEFKVVFAFLLIPIYLFSLTYISGNIMPIADWAPFL